MKAMKKVFALLLAVVLLLGLSTTAFAATINVNGVAGQEYTAYKIFDVANSYQQASNGTYYKDTDSNSYTETKPTNFQNDGTGNPVMYKKITSYTIEDSSPWFNIVMNYMGYVNDAGTWKKDDSEALSPYRGKGIGMALQSENTYSVSVYESEEPDDSFDAAAFAAYLIANKPTGATAAGSKTAIDNGTATIASLAAGYYLVDSSLGALCILNTAADEVTVNEKNAKPTLEKTVEEDSTGLFGETATADFNQVVNFKLTVNTGENAAHLGTGDDKDFVITDTLPNGMTYQDNLNIERWTVDTDYTVVYTAETETDPAKIEITLKDSKLKTLDENTTIDITYSAKVDQDAVVYKVGETLNSNDNTAILKYGTYETLEVTAKVYTYEIGSGITKVDGSTSDPLKDVEFVLSKNATVEGVTTTYYAELIEVKNASEEVIGYKLNGWNTDKANATAIVTNADGKFNVMGLDAGTYTLTETKTNDGYNLLTDTITVVIDKDTSEGAADGAVTVKYKYTNDTGTAGTEIIVENNTGTELPSTGGIGTTIFTVVGIVLMAGAAIILITKKRMN